MMFLTKLFSAFSAEKLAGLLLLGFLLMIPFSIAGSYLLLVPAFIIFIFLRNWRQPLFSEDYQFFFLLFALFSVVSSFFAFRPELSFNDNRELLLFLLFPLLGYFLKDERFRRQSFFVVQIAFGIAAIVGLIQALNWGVTIEQRIRGFCSHWLTYSGLLMLVLVYGGIVFLESEKKKRRILYLVILILISLAVLFSLTRSVWIAAGFGFALYFLFYKPKIFLAFFLLTITVFFISPSNIQRRVCSIFDPKDPSNQDRLRIFFSGWKIIRAHPLFGVGSDNVPEVIAAFPERYKHPEAEHIEMHLHNTYLQMFAERGVFALINFLIAFFLLLKKAWRLSKQNIYARALFFTLLAFILQGMFEYNFGDSELKFLLFYLIAFTFVENKGVENEL